MSIANPTSLAQLVFGPAAREPDRRAITTLDDSVTYAQLRDLIVSFAQHMRARGIDQGARVGLDVEHPIIATALTFACALLGATWLRVHADSVAHPLLRMSHHIHMGPPSATGRARLIQIDPGWSRPPPGPLARPDPTPFPGYRSPRDAWTIAHSSGTTGQPKYIMLAESVMWHRAHEDYLARGRPNPVFLSMFPLLAYPGTVTLLRTLAVTGTVLFGSAAELFGHTHIDTIYGGPNHFLDFMNACPPNGTRVSEVAIGGGQAGGPLFARLWNYAETITHFYASTEASIVCANTLTSASVEALRPSVGRPVSGALVQIVDDTGASLPPGTEGAIRIRHDGHTATGYVGEPGLSAHAFRDGWFHPGDLGMLDADGALHITGRIDDVLNIGGVKINAGTLDEALRAHPGLADAACFTEAGPGGMNELVVALCPAAGTDPATIVTALRAQFPRPITRGVMPRRYYVLEALPRNENAKTLRRALADATRGAPVIAG